MSAEFLPLRSKIFGDIYFSMDDGLAETRHVFLNANDLENRFKNLNSNLNLNSKFTILELGLGTGLNFLATWELFDKTAPKEALLEFISCEQYPLDKNQIENALSIFPEIKKYLKIWLKFYPMNINGHHFLPLIPGRVHLHCLFGEALTVFKNLDTQADVLFLDGFAPSKNPALWRLELFQELARFCQPGVTSFSTYSCAGWVRENLKQAGFQVNKIKGFGRKNEMLVGIYQNKNNCPADIPSSIPSPISPKSRIKNVAVIGAGIAGTSMAWVLSQCGVTVNLFDPLGMAGAASGNPWGMIRPFLTVDHSLPDQILSQSAWLSMRTVEYLQDQNFSIQVLFKKIRQAAHLARLQKRYQKLWDQKHPALNLISENLYEIAPAFVLSPIEYCQALVAAGGDRIKLDLEAIKFNQIPELLNAFDAVIITAGYQSQDLVEAHLGIKKTPGQISLIPMRPITPGIEKTFEKLAEPICYEGYCLPLMNQEYVLGATYRKSYSQDQEELAILEIKESDHVENLNNLKKILPEFAENLLHSEPKTGRVSVRAAVIDHLPLVGSLGGPDSKLWINTGHGSKGLSTGILSAWVIATELLGYTCPVSIKAREALSPGRISRSIKNS